MSSIHDVPIPSKKLTTLDAVNAGNMLVCIDAENISHSISAGPKECIDWIYTYATDEQHSIERVLGFCLKKPLTGRRFKAAPNPHSGGRKKGDRAYRGDVRAQPINKHLWTATQLSQAGAEVINREARQDVDGGKKDNVDVTIASEMIARALISRMTALRHRIDSVLLLSGDGDFDAALRVLNRQNFMTIVASIERDISHYLIREATHVILMDEVFTPRKRASILSAQEFDALLQKKNGGIAPPAPPVLTSIGQLSPADASDVQCGPAVFPTDDPGPVILPATSHMNTPEDSDASLLPMVSLLIRSPHQFAQEQGISEASANDVKRQLLKYFRQIIGH